MSSDREEFLNLVREAENPSDADERRVLAAVHSAIAVSFTSSTAASVSSAMSKLATGKATTGVATNAWLAHSVSAALGSKLGILALCAAASFGAGNSVATDAGSSASARPASSQVDVASESQQGLSPVLHDAIESMPHPIATLEIVQPKPTASTTPSHAFGAARPSQPEAQEQRSTSARSPVPPASLEGELWLLKNVQAALRRGDGSEALRLLDAHGSLDRRLLAERSAARILALCAAGRVEEARRAATEFTVAHPGSMHQRAVAKSCVTNRQTRDP